MMVDGLTIVTASINGRRATLINEGAAGVVREVRRLLGLRRCINCGRWVRPEDAWFVEIVNNKVTRVVCRDCVRGVMRGLMAIKC